MPTGPHDVRARVLQIAAVYDKEFLNQVEAEYGLIRSQPKNPLASVTTSGRQHIRVLLTNGSIDGTTELMRALPNLGLICCLGSGYEKIDIGVARERGIQVTHSPGANASSVADMAVTMLLASVRQLSSAPCLCGGRPVAGICRPPAGRARHDRAEGRDRRAW